MLIRQAQAKDLPTLFPWMVEFVVKAYPQRPADETHIQAVLLNCMNGHVLLVAEEDGEILGTIIGLYTPHALNPSISTLTELAWWVPEKYRKEGVGAALLEVFSSLKGTDITVMTLLPDSKQAEPFLNKFGFQLSELTLTKDNRVDNG